MQSTPKYNMAVQKEISEVQGKTLTFTCTSGLTTPVVVTQDGEGVDDCQINPVTTDTSMNQRFAQTLAKARINWTKRFSANNAD